MRIGILESHQELSATPQYFVTGAKAKRLVEELHVCERIEGVADRIRIVVQQSWAVISKWLKNAARYDSHKMLQARIVFPSGAQFGFSRWPSVDQRSAGCQ